MDENIDEVLKRFNWNRESMLGKSSFGIVLSVKTDDEKIVAVKFSEVKNKLECDIWPILFHPNIIPLYNIIETSLDNVKAFVMPQHKINFANYLQGSLLSRKDDSLTLITRWLYQILCGLRYLHRRKLSHLDLKLDNILLSSNDNAIISDFTHISDVFLVTSEHFMGMPYYWKPPELWNCSPEADHVAQLLDVWCYGLIVLESITRLSLSRYLKSWNNLKLSPHEDVADFIHSIFNDDINLENYVKKAYPLENDLTRIEVFKDFLKSFLQMKPSKRILVEQSFNHAVFSN